LIFNLLCAPCVAALGAIRREMNSAKWFWFAVAYQSIFAYTVSLCVYQIGLIFSGSFGLGALAALPAAGCFFYMLFKKEKTRKNEKG
jgi:ferrous iron transport protein B